MLIRFAVYITVMFLWCLICGAVLTTLSLPAWLVTLLTLLFPFLLCEMLSRGKNK